MAVSSMVEPAVSEKAIRMISNSDRGECGEALEKDIALLAGAINAMILDLGAVLNPSSVSE